MIKHQFKTLFVAVLLLFAADVTFGQQIKVKQVKLSNGLTVILNEDHTKTEVFGMVVVKAGAKNDPKDATGMAHYMEHMLFKGTTELGTSDWAKEKPHIDRIFELYDQLGKTKEDSLRAKIQKEINKESVEAGKYSILNETSALIDQMGGTNLNAGTGWDQTVYYNSFPPNQINRWIELYSHRFISPVFRAFQSELETVYEEKNMYSDNFFSNLLEAFNKNLFKVHPYGQQTIIGTTDHLKNPSLNKMYQFFKTYYVANNMALVMVGDFDTETILPLIEEKFGQWERGDLPTEPTYTENSFNGREYVEGRYSPIKLGILGFRSVPSGHKDELPLSLFSTLLSNYNQTGAIDKMVLNGDVMAAQLLPMHYQDQGAEIVLIVPKLIGQKTATAEKMVLDAIKKARDGEFDEALLEQAKREKYVEYQLGMESFEGKGYALSELFTQGKDIKEINEYPSKIQSITKEDIVNVAKKYYGDNYLAFFSKMGSPKKEKLEKPGFDPVVTKTSEKSVFAKHFEQIPEANFKVDFVNFNGDVITMDVAKGVKLHYTTNPKNDIFTATIAYKVGDMAIKEAGLVSSLMGLAGTKDLKRDELKKEFAKLGCTYNFHANKEEVSVELTGLEAELDQALALLGKLIAEPVVTADDVKTAYKALMSERKFDTEDPASVAQTLAGYIMYGDNTESLRRISKKQAKKFKVEDFNRLSKQIFSYNTEIHYAGKFDGVKVKDLINKNIKFAANPLKSDVETDIEIKKYNENVVYFVNRKDAVQSNILFLVNGKTFNRDEVPVMEAFNTYFGGGFSGLVLQEIREYRSMAYSASAYFRKPSKDGMATCFKGYIGTQADKTIEAIKVFSELKDSMPEKSERMSFIKPSLIQSCITSKPDFRYITEQVEAWKKQGYDSDPSTFTMMRAQSLTFDDIVTFYNDNLKDKPMVIMIVGDKRKIDMAELAKYGRIEFVKQKSLFVK